MYSKKSWSESAEVVVEPPNVDVSYRKVQPILLQFTEKRARAENGDEQNPKLQENQTENRYANSDTEGSSGTWLN